MGHAVRKRVFRPMRTAKAQIRLRCPLTESFDTRECINGEHMPGCDFAHARDESESVHFAHVRRHIFA